MKAKYRASDPENKMLLASFSIMTDEEIELMQLFAVHGSGLEVTYIPTQKSIDRLRDYLFRACETIQQLKRQVEELKGA